MAPEQLVGGRYELDELVGAGGMSSVYRARDTVLERNVALKILHPQYSSDAEYVERFRREARAVAQLSHPNIVTVIDRGEDAGRQFIVFELIDGENLKDLVDRTGPLAVDDALGIAVEIAHALAFAHENGIVHRDVKPQNVLLNGERRPKVTDFGIARSLKVEGVTQAGTVLGTSNYLAPEQASGTGIGPQTDVYSLGVVLFELLTGAVPFAGDSFVQIAMQHVNQPPPDVRERRPEVPARVAAAINRALAKDPRHRFPSMSSFAAELEACLAAPQEGSQDGETLIVAPRASPSPPARARLWPIAVALLACVAAAAILYGLLGARGGSPSRAATPPQRPIHLSGVGAYDPYGDGHEHDDLAALATDGNPTTFWTTEDYFAGLGKPGVGLVLDAHRSVRPSRLVVRSDTPGVSALVRAGDARSGPFRAVSGSRMLGLRTVFPIESRRAWRYWVVWITNLGGGHFAHVNTVSAPG